MKRTEEIIGFPVIDISSGERLGRVKDFIFNGDNGTIDYLVVENDTGGLMARVVSTEDILGIGEYAVTIGSESSIKELNSTVEAVRLLKRDIKIKNIGILTKKGTIIGQTGDVYINEDDNCKIIGLEFITKNGTGTDGSNKVLPADLVITYGRNLVIVEEDAENKIVDGINELSSGIGEVGDGQDEVFSQDGNNWNYAAATDDTFETNENKQTDMKSGSAVVEREDYEIPADEGQPESAANLFEQRQRKYLIGRRATRTIVDGEGNILVEEGMIINNEIIDETIKSGKLVELIMNNKE